MLSNFLVCLCRHSHSLLSFYWYFRKTIYHLILHSKISDLNYTLIHFIAKKFQNIFWFKNTFPIQQKGLSPTPPPGKKIRISSGGGCTLRILIEKLTFDLVCGLWIRKAIKSVLTSLLSTFIIVGSPWTETHPMHNAWGIFKDTADLALPP